MNVRGGHSLESKPAPALNIASAISAGVRVAIHVRCGIPRQLPEGTGIKGGANLAHPGEGNALLRPSGAVMVAGLAMTASPAL